VRRSTWHGRSALRSYPHKGCAGLSPIGQRSPSVWQNPNGGENVTDVSLSKRLWGVRPGVRPTTEVSDIGHNCPPSKAIGSGVAE